MSKPRFAAFDQGQQPVISCLNLATVPLGVDFDKLIAALQLYVDEHFLPVWGTPCKLVKSAAKIPAGNWGIVFTDTADAAGALGYHDLTPDGFPLSKVFVKTTIDDDELVSVTASHELAEMLVDPGIQMGAYGPANTWYAYETADAVERDSFLVNKIPLSNFVYPAWFESFHKPGATKFDHMHSCRRPFEITPGGYMPVFVNGRWKQIFGSRERALKGIVKSHHPRTARRGEKTKPRLSNPKPVKLSRKSSVAGSPDLRP